MDGTALYECVAVLFVAQILGWDLSAAQQFMVVALALLTSIGVAGIPSASLVAITVIVNNVGIPNSDGSLRGGMFATGRIALAADAPVPTLPHAAVRSEAGQSYVWTIEGGKLTRRIVIVGRRDDSAGIVEVKTALPAGAKVLAARFDNLKDGAPAIVRAPAPAPVKSS
jgi:multidrug efflux pump subunit AcrA (membrane-fusion protein)